MRKAVLFEVFAFRCPYSDTENYDGYACNHPEQREKETIDGKEVGCCFCFTCPLGIEAEQQDLTDRDDPDAIKDEIDWDGSCEDGVVPDEEYLLVNMGEDATQDEKDALYSYDLYMHRYDKKWLDEHGIANGLCN